MCFEAIISKRRSSTSSKIQNEVVTTGIFKEPVRGRVRLQEINWRLEQQKSWQPTLGCLVINFE
jgi:hypothetical protein